MRQLPTGTVTFFFSDIEGSTRLVQRLGPDYRTVLDRHAAILRGAIAGGGMEVSTEGDSFFAVFPSATAAVDAACAVQTGLAAEDWPETGAVRVRIGLHTGEATIGGDNYAGLEVHRASRIGNAGHGGQIVVSSTTRDVVAAADGTVPFRDLGRHRLRGIDEPIRLFQIDVSGLPTAFPPLRSDVSKPHNLPAAATPLVGRDDEMAALAGAIADHRVVTLVGPGGVGKTRLALQAAADALPSFDDGAFLVELAGIADAELVVPTIAATLGLGDPDLLAAHLADKAILLVLDNFEHVMTAAGEVSRLVAAAPGARLLVTSQAPLRIAGERVVPVGPLSVDGPALRLFVERAEAADPSFRADDDPESVRHLVATLGGLPLAIELAAARVSLLPPRTMVERLAAGLEVGVGRSDAPERHRSLAAAITWSVDLLSTADRAALQRLAVFAGGAGFEAAEEVVAGPPVDDAFASLAELVDRSLVVRDVTGVSSVRLQLLEPVRQFAAADLEASGDAAAAAERHTAYFCELAAAAEAGLLSDRVPLWLARLEEDLDNLRAVLGRLIAAGDADRALTLVGSAWRFFQGRGHLAELGLWLDRAFALPDADRPGRARVKGLMARGALHYWRSQEEDAVAAYREAIRSAPAGDEALLAEAVFGLATSQIMAGATAEGRATLTEAAAMYERLGDVGGLADIAAGEAFAEIHDRDLSAAAPLMERAGALYTAAGRRTHAIQTVIAQSAVAIGEARYEDAHRFALQALAAAEELGDLFHVVWALEYVARIDADLGRTEDAAALTGACRTARSWLGGGWSPVVVGLDDAATRLHQMLGADEAERAIAAGFEIDIDGAVQLARREVDRAASTPPAP